jgi:Polyketide cyclase / dehydrase and lipid transport
MGKAQKIGIGIAAVIVVFLIVVVTRPDTYHVERSKVISAAPEAIYGHVADFQQWKAWSPWDKIDPNMKRTFGGKQGTVGATYAWVGNDEVGEGDMTITSVDPGKRVEINLHFVKPFESSAKNGFKFEPEGKDTKVTWYMDGNNNFLSKIMCLFMDMDKMIGKDFEKGLDSMKQVSEAAPAPAAAN